MIKRIGILGAGAWGITLARLLTEKKHKVTLWEFSSRQAKNLKLKRKLSYFPYVTIPKQVCITDNLGDTCINKDFLILAVPSHTLRGVLKNLALLKINFSSTIVVSVIKGIENNTLMLMSEIIKHEIKGKSRIVSLSGPTIAKEVAQKMPTAATAASLDADAAGMCQQLLITPYLRIYTHQDIKGVEAGGALKNIFAIAAGICDGLNLGYNAKSALITRGIREIVQLGVKIGGQPSTFLGLSGLGDLIVTCFSKYSRNRSIGEKIGKGSSLSAAEREIIMIAEGIKTALSAYRLGQKYKIELPIINQVYKVLYEKKPPKEAIKELMLRQAKPESILKFGRMVI